MLYPVVAKATICKPTASELVIGFGTATPTQSIFYARPRTRSRFVRLECDFEDVPSLRVYKPAGRDSEAGIGNISAVVFGGTFGARVDVWNKFTTLEIPEVDAPVDVRVSLKSGVSFRLIDVGAFW